ncbi:hypothetical protein [Sporosarcina jiandibaonis]|uniref:hypothetical protein n=1 Tax=Sporosarcina jiandibaonis TaxID=2715535 RepID=UPI001555BE90|nr:hypothetical protein [Sporosarcina jiandibaonis]
MTKLSEASFAAIKGEIHDGRLTVSGMREYLIGIFFYSGIVVGISFFAAHLNTIGWDTLSAKWHTIYYIEAVLFSLHLLLILLLWNNTFIQKLLSVGMVLFTYKAVLDSYLVILMFSKDRGMYDAYLPVVLIILLIGIIIHLTVLFKWINSLKQKNNKVGKSKGKKDSKFIILFPAIFLLTALTSTVIKNGLLGDYELGFGVFLVTVVSFGLLIAAVEFLIAMYCIFKYPSFLVRNFDK